MKEECKHLPMNNEKCVIELNHLFSDRKDPGEQIWRTEDKRITDSGLGSGELPDQRPLAVKDL